MNIKEEIRKYFERMLEDDIDIYAAKDNLMELVEEIAAEYENIE